MRGDEGQWIWTGARGGDNSGGGRRTAEDLAAGEICRADCDKDEYYFLAKTRWERLDMQPHEGQGWRLYAAGQLKENGVGVGVGVGVGGVG
jgi:hypothetical protein